MCYMGSCPNEQEIILSIIAPKDYPRRVFLIAVPTAGTKTVSATALM